MGYIDDTYLKGSTFHDCEINVSSTVKLFTDLGLTLNMAKSVLIPSQSITFLGFVLNSAQMTVSPTPSKAMKVESKAVELLHNQSPTIRTVSEMIGLMVASFRGVTYGPLYYRQLEISGFHLTSSPPCWSTEQKKKKIVWELDSIIMQLFCAPTWPS